MYYLEWVGKLVWTFLPIGFANMAPVLVKSHLQWLARPIKESWFGSHKTWRGLIVGSFFGGVVYLGQVGITLYFPTLADWSLLNYSKTPWWFGFLFGFAALAGDAAKSFIKRRIGKKPGERWFPFDQIDFVLGGLVLLSFYADISYKLWIVILGLGIIFHVAVNRIGYALKIKNTPW